jgi:hypothetical protein
VRKRIDPGLLRQLEAARERARHPGSEGVAKARAGATVEAIVRIRAETERPPPTAPEMTKLCEELLRRVERLSRERCEDFNVLPMLQSIVVKASPEFLLALLEQPEVEAAVANRAEPAM